MKNRKSHGFTLVELIIVIAVIGVLAAILIPVFANVINKANAKSAMSDARNTLENYIIAAQSSSTPLPGDGRVVIFVQKANKYYVFGYNSNRIVPADNNNDAGYDCTLAELTDPNGPYNMTQAQFEAGVQDQQNHPEHTFDESFTDGIFYLFPASEGIVRGISSSFTDLSDYMDETMGADRIEIVNGILLKVSDSMEAVEVNNTTPTGSNAAPAQSTSPADPTPEQSTTPVDPDPTPEQSAAPEQSTTPVEPYPTPEQTTTPADPTPALENQSITLHISYVMSTTNDDYGTQDFTVPCTVNGRNIDFVGDTVTFTVGDLKDSGIYPTQYQGSDANWISVDSASTQVFVFNGQPMGAGSTRYTFSYTKNVDSTSMVIYISPAGATVTDQQAYGLPSSNIKTEFEKKELRVVSYPIYNEAGLSAIAYDSSTMAMSWYLVNDITLSSNWNPLGLDAQGNVTEFTGTLSGINPNDQTPTVYTISGLNVGLISSQSNAGLFAKIGTGGTVQNLNIITGSTGVTGGYKVGALAGENDGTVTNVTVTGPEIAENPGTYAPAIVSATGLNGNPNSVGGLVGINNGTITGSAVSVTLNGYYAVGGLVGENGADGIIETSDAVVANINSAMTLAELRNPTNASTVEAMAPTQSIGGFVGYNEGTINTNCSATVAQNGIIKGYEYVGGFVGYNEGSGRITGCSTTAINMHGYFCAGGFCGYNACLIDETTGEITSNDDIGVITNCTAGILGVNASMTMAYMQNPTNAGENEDMYPVQIIGGFCGCNDAHIIGCTMALDTTNGVINGYETVGGFCGINTADYGEIVNSTATNVSMNGSLYVGGFVGENDGYIYYDSTLTGAVKPQVVLSDVNGILTLTELGTYDITYVGGFVGINYGTVSESHVRPVISDPVNHPEGDPIMIRGNYSVGGFCGRNREDGVIDKSSVKMSDVTAYYFAGGFAGENFGFIGESYAIVYDINIDLNDTYYGYSTYVGGFIGASRGEVENCYAVVVDVMQGYNFVGGFIGMLYNGGSVTNCYVDADGKINAWYNASPSIGGTNNGYTVTKLYYVYTPSQTFIGTKIALSSLIAANFRIRSGWSTNIWSFPGGTYPNLVNNPR